MLPRAAARRKPQSFRYSKQRRRVRRRGWPGIPPWTGFPAELPLVWVFDPGTRAWAVYHADREMVSLLQNLDSVTGLDAPLVEILHHARSS